MDSNPYCIIVDSSNKIFLSIAGVGILVNSNFEYITPTALGQNQEEISPFVKDKSVLEGPTDDMVITNEPPVDEDCRNGRPIPNNFHYF